MKYSIYKPPITWYLQSIMCELGIAGLTAYCFYNSVYGMVAAIPFCIYMWIKNKNAYVYKSKKKLVADFREGMQMIDVNLSAGYSLENAFVQATVDMAKMRGSKALITNEFTRIGRGIAYNQRVEKLIKEMGERSELREIKSLANLLSTSKIYGGNMLQIIRQFNQTIAQNQILEEEIATLTAEKTLESRIMLTMPFLIIIYMRISTPGYMNVLYESLWGRVVMTICLVIVCVMAIMLDVIAAQNKLICE